MLLVLVRKRLAARGSRGVGFIRRERSQWTLCSSPGMESGNDPGQRSELWDKRAREQPHPLPCCPEPHPSVLGLAVWKAHRRGCHGCLGPLVCLSTHTRSIQSHIFTNIPRVLCAHSDKHTHEHSQKHIHTSTATWPHTHLYSYAHMYPQVLKSGPHTYAVIHTQDIRSFPCTDSYSQIHTFTCVIMWVLTLTNTLI